MKTKSALVIPDLHIPNHDQDALQLVEMYMADHEWDYIIQLGDFLDFSMLHSTSEKNLRRIQGTSVDGDYKAGNKVLDRWVEIAPKSQIVILEGNHDLRIERAIDFTPHRMSGQEVANRFSFGDRGIKWVRHNDVFTLGKANFIHGLYTNATHTTTHGQRFGDNIFYGHVHDIQCKTFPRIRRDGPYVAQSLGHLSDETKADVMWKGGGPSNWEKAVTTFTFFEDGYFQYFISRIYRDRLFVPGGDCYYF